MCDTRPPYISRNLAWALACDLGINLDVISIHQWQEALNKESYWSWPDYCGVDELANMVKNNLLDNINYYRNLGLGTRKIVNKQIVQPNVLCQVGGRVNTQIINFPPL